MGYEGWGSVLDSGIIKILLILVMLSMILPVLASKVVVKLAPLIELILLTKASWLARYASIIWLLRLFKRIKSFLIIKTRRGILVRRRSTATMWVEWLLLFIHLLKGVWWSCSTLLLLISIEHSERLLMLLGYMLLASGGPLIRIHIVAKLTAQTGYFPLNSFNGELRILFDNYLDL